MFRTTLVCGLMTLPASVHAGLIYWGSEGFVENADSKNHVWTAEFTMTLGVFEEGFVPTVENRQQWVGKWTTIGVAKFDPAEARFADVVDAGKSLPAGAGPRVYFWAQNGLDLTKGPEWLLLTRVDWLWPAVSEEDTPALTWTTGTPASTVMGTVGLKGRHLTSARVVPVPVAREQWLAAYFPDSLAKQKPDADPDGDGLSNQLEYFLGSNPADASSRICPEIRRASDGTMLTLRRNPYAQSRFAIESSANMKQWSASGSETLQDRPDLIEVRVPRDATKAAVFFRFKMEPATP